MKVLARRKLCTLDLGGQLKHFLNVVPDGNGII
jgi:hypothetical protein